LHFGFEHAHGHFVLHDVVDAGAAAADVGAPLISLLVNCESEGEIARLAGPLSEGGTTFMPLGNYGFSRKFARVSDRFGVPWQLSLA
jgi:uncharacterized glyoxalase superfamily protein PhnB